MKKDKTTNVNRKESYTDIFAIKELDEMQRFENFRITHKLFITYFWIMIILSLAMLVAAEFPTNAEDNHMLSVFGLICEGINLLLYVIYAALSSAKGVMNEKFAKRVGNKSYLISYFVLGVFYIFFIDLTSVYFRIFIGLAYLAMCIVSLYAMKNNRIVEKLNCEE